MPSKVLLSSRLLLAALLASSTLLLAGCGNSGKKTAIVEGTVTVDNAPANSGTVVFKSAAGTISGTIQPDGTYRALDVPIGEVQVTVTGPVMPAVATAPVTKDMPGAVGAVGKPVPIPAKYGKVETSNLKFDVKAGTNKYPIVLTK